MPSKVGMPIGKIFKNPPLASLVKYIMLIEPNRPFKPVLKTFKIAESISNEYPNWACPVYSIMGKLTKSCRMRYDFLDFSKVHGIYMI